MTNNKMENSSNNEDVYLALFLRDLADSIDSKKLQQEELKCVGEFYMNYKMNEEISKESKSNEESNFDDMDIIRFLTMGWYIYTQLINKDNNNPTGPAEYYESTLNEPD
jgi:hypothetical protein